MSSPAARAAVEIVASTSFVLPEAPARMTEFLSPLALADGGTAFLAKFEGEKEQVLVIRRPGNLSVVRPAALGLTSTSTSPFLRLASHEAEVLFLAYNSNGGSGLSIYRADPGGPVLLVDDPVAAAQQQPQRNSWSAGEWKARSGAFVMQSYATEGRPGGPNFRVHTALSHYRAGTMRRIAATQTGTPAFAGFSHLALDPSGDRVLFRGIFSSTSKPGAPATYESGIYAWEDGRLSSILDPQTRYADGSVSIASCAIGDDQAIAFHDSRRFAIALFADGRITELVANGARTADGLRIELDRIEASPQVLRIDDRFVYFTAPRRILNPSGEEGVRNDLVLRVPRAGGRAEVFFHPARVFSDAARVSLSDLALTGDTPHLMFRAGGYRGTQVAIYRVSPPFERIPFPAVPDGYPSVVFPDDWPYYRDSTLVAQVDGPGPFTYAWSFNGQPVTASDSLQFRATNGTLRLFPFAQSYHSGDYTLAVTNAVGTSIVSASVSVGSDFHDGGTPPALVNYSVRGYSTSAEGIFTAGFSLLAPIEVSWNANGQVLTPIAGTLQRLLVRAVGPGLAPFARDDVVPAPATRLELFRGTQIIGRNDGDWSIDPTIGAFSAVVGAFPLLPGSRDSALLASLPPQAYTAQAAAPAGDGTVLMEFYVVEGRGNLRNLSARGLVADLEPRSLTLGFVISGSGSRPVLLRAVGPGLQALGVSNAAPQPRLELFNAENTLLARNLAHDTAPNSTEIRSAAAAFGAFPLAAGSADAALLLQLPAGVYITRVAAAPGSPAGVALIELYTKIGYETRN